jgi:23S rRNA pseudouridine1911/1915/1917 synthase
MRFESDTKTSLLDFLATHYPEASRTTLRQMLEQSRICVNGGIEKIARRELAPGDTVDVDRKTSRRNLPPEIQIFFEDDDLIVIDKAAGLLSVATEGEKEKTAQAYLNTYLRSPRHIERVHVVHRIDRDTSGVMMFTRNFNVREAMKERFARHEIERVYVALIEGRLPKPEGTFRSNLEEGSDLTVRSVRPPGGKLAITHYRTLGAGDSYSMLEVTLETGRRNQIRAHLSEAGHPVVGDVRYGAKTNPIGRLGLHALVLGFEHPGDGRPMRFTSPLPDAFRKLVL